MSWLTYSGRTKRRRIAKRVTDDLDYIRGPYVAEKSISNCNDRSENSDTCVMVNSHVLQDNVTLSRPASDCCTVSDEDENLVDAEICDDNYSSCSGETGSCSLSDNESRLGDFRNDLTQWSVTNNITHHALKNLLDILHPHFPNLPHDPRSLLHTPRAAPCKTLGSGIYFHFGVRNGIQERVVGGLDNYSNPMIEKMRSQSVKPLLTITINCDGIPTSSSSSREFWPILAKLDQAVNKAPFLVGLYFGKTGKPDSAELYLQEFVSEMKEISHLGIFVNGIEYDLKISCIIADSPARSFIKCIKNHNSYNSCEKCKSSQFYYKNRVVFQNTEELAELRSDSSFRLQSDSCHHTGVSPLVELEAGLISQVPLDPLHLIYLGIMRKLLFIWSGIAGKGCRKYRLKPSLLSALSKDIQNTRTFTPSEFSRKPRAISELKTWKGKEFRTFLLYIGPVVLRKYLPKQLYNHFMLLHVGIYILCSEKSSAAWLEYAEAILKIFVVQSGILYGQTMLIYNTHNLLHIVEDVRNYGPLDTFSAFCFETFLGAIKHKLRMHSKELQQIVNRVSELKYAVMGNVTSTKSQKHIKPMHRHLSGPLLHDEMNQNVTQYRKLIVSNKFVVGSSDSDNCFGTNSGNIVFVKNIYREENRYFVICCPVVSKQNFYLYPCDSIKLDIFEVTEHQAESSSYVSLPVQYLRYKYFAIKTGKKRICIPLVGSLETILM